MDTKSMFGDNFKIYIYRQWTDISGSYHIEMLIEIFLLNEIYWSNKIDV
jgi:hypothetical protein